MNKYVSLSLFILVGGMHNMNAFAGEFKFNNKNLNALSALICHTTTEAESENIISLHKFLVDKSKLGSAKNDVSYELTGTCNIQYDKKTKKIISYGDEFTFNINLKDSKMANGKIGIKDIELHFKKNSLKMIRIKDPLLLIEKTYQLNNSEWAQSDSLFSFNKKKSFALRIGRKTAAVEKNSTLMFSKNKLKSKFYNTWSYSAIGCSQTTGRTTQEHCQKISDLAN